MADFGLNYFNGALFVRGDKERIKAFWKDFIVAKDKESIDEGLLECIEEYGEIEYDKKGRSHWFNFGHPKLPKDESNNGNWASVEKLVRPSDTSIRFVMYLIPRTNFFIAICELYPELDFFFRTHGLRLGSLFACFNKLYGQSAEGNFLDYKDIKHYAAAKNDYDGDYDDYDDYDDYEEVFEILDEAQADWESGDWYKKHWGKKPSTKKKK